MTEASWWEAPYQHLCVERHDVGQRRIALVRLDQPDKRNAMSDEMTASWARAMGLLRVDPSLAAVVVTGNGKAFCSGGDLSWIASEPDATAADLRVRMTAFYRTWLTVKSLEVPTIAAINGAAIGAGLAVALAHDIRYVADSAILGVPFTALGLHPGMATTWSLPEVAGLAVARDLLLTGRMITGEEAVPLGIASRAVPAADLLEVAMAAATRVAQAAPVATRLTTVALRNAGHASFDDAIRWEGLAQAVTMTTADLQEGIRAAAQRRPAVFTGA
ncbi:MAG: enoyl-CoA hydratase/isomerase family protein [Austwickia sp.]|nr:enoyl-CoA hydratase/isomerase family protein [Austwickia sp.]MBK8435947.1 enoyl-CoA hydratase/isomerase family protein [Austwickia sp.]MBK9101631.1 enoyl-CoA hydratase/isomerase family protein [Austwickia sp.]